MYYEADLRGFILSPLNAEFQPSSFELVACESAKLVYETVVNVHSFGTFWKRTRLIYHRLREMEIWTRVPPKVSARISQTAYFVLHAARAIQQNKRYPTGTMGWLIKTKYNAVKAVKTTSCTHILGFCGRYQRFCHHCSKRVLAYWKGRWTSLLVAVMPRYFSVILWVFQENRFFALWPRY